MEDLPRRKLQELYATYGPALCENHSRCEGLLRDLCAPEMRDINTTYRREIHLLIEALKDGVAADLLAPQPGIPRQAQLPLLTERLRANTGLTQDAAVWAVESWALAMNIATEAQITAERAASVSVSRKPPAPKPSKPVAVRASLGAAVKPPQVSTTSHPPTSIQTGSSQGASTRIDNTRLPGQYPASKLNLPTPPVTPATEKSPVPNWVIIGPILIFLAIALYYGYRRNQPANDRPVLTQPGQITTSGDAPVGLTQPAPAGVGAGTEQEPAGSVEVPLVNGDLPPAPKLGPDR